VVLICISLMARNGEHFFMRSLVIWISFFWKNSAQFICSFLHQAFEFWGV
jgi:hypothetical protein